MSRASEVIVLAEDQRHQSFVRRYLVRLGFDARVIRNQELPSARGAGEQWVRTRYADAVKGLRGRHARTILVVAIDADTGTVKHRLQQLAESLSQSGQSPRAADEEIAHLVPKRNIETWVLCLSGEGVDELTDYKRDSRISGLLSASAASLFDWTRPGTVVPSVCVDSIKLSFAELQRVKNPQ